MEFFDLDCWKESHVLVIKVYQIVKKFPKEEKYGLVDQLRRASSSITANIAEGSGRYHYKDRIHFYYQSRGSLKEVQSFLILARDLRYIENECFNDLWSQAKKSEMLINGLIRSSENRRITNNV